MADADPAPSAQQPDIGAYRDGIEDLVAEVAGQDGADGKRKVVHLLGTRLDEPQFAAVLQHLAGGGEGSVAELIDEVRGYEPNPRTSATDLTALVRIYLLSQIDTLWWGATAPFETDQDVRTTQRLVDLGPLERRGELRFQYRKQAQKLPMRLVRALERRTVPDRRPRTAGLRFARTRREVVPLLNALAADFASASPAGTPALWVNSLARSVAHQRHLRGLGYAAVLSSAHCVGYAVDLEMRWLARFDADRCLQQLLMQRRDAGEINVIDEGQAWHICVNPDAGPRLLREFHAESGS